VRWPARAIPKVAADEPAHGAGGGLVEVYEQLRACALVGDGQGWRLGLAVVHRQGVAGWMRAIDGLPAPASPPAAAGGSAAALVPAGEPLVAVLASMALACVAGG
jgi:hypothetical protein